MNNIVKTGLIVILFLAGICMAFLAGRLSSNQPYPTDFDPAMTQPYSSAPPSETAARSFIAENQDNPSAAAPVPNQFGEPSPDDAFSGESHPDAEHTQKTASESFRPDPYELRRIFPDNQALPPVDREEFMAKQQEKERRNRQYGQIAANKATPAEIEAYYAEQTALAEDSAMILTFILTEYADRMSQEDIKKHEFLLENFEKRLERIPAKKAEALARIQ
jgi:hypothetical protein